MVLRALLLSSCSVLMIAAVGCVEDKSSDGGSTATHSSVPAASVVPEKLDVRSQAEIEQAFKHSGLNLCQQLTLPIPNKGYKYETTTEYYLLERVCPSKSMSDLDAIPGLVFISVETFSNKSFQDQGISVHRDEILKGIHESSIAWRYGQFLIVVLHTTPTSAVERLIPTMSKIGATVAFDNRSRSATRDTATKSTSPTSSSSTGEPGVSPTRYVDELG